MDCLDRTNVVEGMLAKRALKLQLIKLGILTEQDRIENQNTFDYVFRNGVLFHNLLYNYEQALTPWRVFQLESCEEF